MELRPQHLHVLLSVTCLPVKTVSQLLDVFALLLLWCVTGAPQVLQTMVVLDKTLTMLDHTWPTSDRIRAQS